MEGWEEGRWWAKITMWRRDERWKERNGRGRLRGRAEGRSALLHHVGQCYIIAPSQCVSPSHTHYYCTVDTHVRGSLLKTSLAAKWTATDKLDQHSIMLFRFVGVTADFTLFCFTRWNETVMSSAYACVLMCNESITLYYYKNHVRQLTSQ